MFNENLFFVKRGVIQVAGFLFSDDNPLRFVITFFKAVSSKLTALL